MWEKQGGGLTIGGARQGWNISFGILSGDKVKVGEVRSRRDLPGDQGAGGPGRLRNWSRESSNIGTLVVGEFQYWNLWNLGCYRYVGRVPILEPLELELSGSNIEF